MTRSENQVVNIKLSPVVEASTINSFVVRAIGFMAVQKHLGQRIILH